MSTRVHLPWGWATAFLLTLLPVGRAELQPAEVFVVYNRVVPASREIALYYMQKRGIPAGQAIGLDLPPLEKGEDLSREAYVAKVRAPLRGYLRLQNLQDKIKCIVTVYGVPLRVEGTGIVAQDKPLLRDVTAELDTTTAQMEGIIAALETFTSAPKPASSPTTRRSDPPTLLARFDALKEKALVRVRTTKSPAEAASLTQQLGELLQRGEGMAILATHLQGKDPAGQQAIAAMQAGFVRQRDELKSLLAECPRGPRRREAHKMLAELFGIRGLIPHLQEDQACLEGKETQAALDSELSLLWWNDYPLYRWVLNPMCWRIWHSPEFSTKEVREQLAQPVVMVSRLDGPSVAIVRRMIDDAIVVEDKGLEGKVYIDARGIQATENGYGPYDQDLRDLAKMLQKTDLTVVLDDKPELFQPGQCPDAALYCGWYSLGKYVDAFQWNRGSVGYHIASSEAVSLHSPIAKYWCKRMLEEGVAATLGPVAEPYLVSFPRPHDFFGLLLTGKYTLVECYYHTVALQSWMQTLLGDPLYMPYKKHPRVQVEDVVPAEWINGPGQQSQQ
jgi:uncharacterized protein (TIGR03790 family)